MSHVNRRGFLGLLLASAAVVAVPSSAWAAGTTVTIDVIESKPGSGIFDRVRIPTDLATNAGKVRAAAMEAAGNRALSIAQAQNLSRPQANGLLTRLFRPSMRSMSKGIWGTLLELGLIAGFTWALTSATVDLANGNNTATTTTNCTVAPVMPGQITDVSTGIYTNSQRSVAYAYIRTTGQSSGGTIPAPAGWSWSYQRAISTTNGVTTYEVWFTKNAGCGERVPFPAVPLPSQAVPNPANQKPTNPGADIGKTITGLWQQAQNEANVPVPVIPGTVEEPGITIPAAPVSPVFNVPDVSAPDFTDPLPALSPDPASATVQFGPAPVGTFPGGETTKEPSPTPTPTTTPTTTPTSSTPPYATGDPVDPTAPDELPTFDKFVNPFKTLFQPFSGAFNTGSVACPAFRIPTTTTFGRFGGIAGQSVTVHCQLFEPYRAAITTASAGVGAYFAISNVLKA